MSGPITWKNVNQPNFGASNTLALAASKQLSNAFESGSQRLIDQGQYNEKQNNDAFAAKLAQYSDYDDLSGAKGNLFQGLEGQNIDTVAALDSYNSSIDRLGQNETFALDRSERQRNETDRLAVDAALGQLSKSFTAASPSMTEDNIRDTGINNFLTPSQQARYMEKALPVYGSTSNEKATAAQNKATKVELLKHSLGIERDRLKEEAKAANRDSEGFSASAKGTMNILNYENVDKDDADYLRHKDFVRKWDANENKVLLNGEWTYVPSEIMESVTQQLVTKGKNQPWNYIPFVNDDPDFDAKVRDKAIINALELKRQAGDNFDDPT